VRQSSLDAGSKQQKEKVMRIFKNDLTHYFLREARPAAGQLPEELQQIF